MRASSTIGTPADPLPKELATSNTSFSLVAAHSVEVVKVTGAKAYSLNIALNVFPN